MKAYRFLLALLFVMPSLAASSQSEDKPIDKVQYRITYKTKFIEDTTNVDSTGHYRYKDDDMRLDIGRKVSSFYSGRTAAMLEFMNKSFERSNTIDLRNFSLPKPKITWKVYRNYPEGQTSFLTSVLMNSYRVSEPTQTPDWQLLEDTCTILGYHCSKADCDFKGRHWTAWYTVDIPLDGGPWKLMGLPGLILKAEDSAHQYIFEASSLEQIDGKEDLTLDSGYKKYEAVTQRQLDQMSRTATAADMMFEGGKRIVQVKDKDGNELSDAELRRKYGKTRPYNPIEVIK